MLRTSPVRPLPPAPPGGQRPHRSRVSAPAVTKGRIHQSIVNWCFEPYWKPEALCQIATQLGCKSIELIAPEYWPTLKKHGLCCALASSHGFDKGMNNPRYQPMCLAKIRDGNRRLQRVRLSERHHVHRFP